MYRYAPCFVLFDHRCIVCAGNWVSMLVFSGNGGVLCVLIVLMVISMAIYNEGVKLGYRRGLVYSIYNICCGMLVVSVNMNS